jgi:hypothetical protein
LFKAIYKLKHAPCAWYTKIYECLNNQGFEKKTKDGILYIFCEREKVALLLFYVDDVYLIGNHIEKIQWIIIETKRRFEMIDVKLLNLLLGIDFFFR